MNIEDPLHRDVFDSPANTGRAYEVDLCAKFIGIRRTRLGMMRANWGWRKTDKGTLRDVGYQILIDRVKDLEEMYAGLLIAITEKTDVDVDGATIMQLEGMLDSILPMEEMLELLVRKMEKAAPTSQKA